MTFIVYIYISYSIYRDINISKYTSFFIGSGVHPPLEPLRLAHRSARPGRRQRLHAPLRLPRHVAELLHQPHLRHISLKMYTLLYIKAFIGSTLILYIYIYISIIYILHIYIHYIIHYIYTLYNILYIYFIRGGDVSWAGGVLLLQLRGLLAPPSPPGALVALGGPLKLLHLQAAPI